MKKVIVSLCLVITATLTFIGCDKASGGKTSVLGVKISTLGGHKFEKMEMMGKTMYVTKLDLKNGFAANVNIFSDENKGTLPTMDEYVKGAVSQYKTIGTKMQVQSKTDDAVTISGTMGEMKLYQRLFRDRAKNRYIVVTGTYREDSDKATIEQCVDSVEL